MARDYPAHLRALAPQLRQSLHVVKKLYPEAHFPDIYFNVGQFRSSGTVSDRGMLLGAEVFAVRDDTPLHEFTPARRGILSPNATAAVQHRSRARSHPTTVERQDTLLERALIEGAAELVASLVVPEAPVPVNKEFAERHEREIWNRFAHEMDGTDTSQ